MTKAFNLVLVMLMLGTFFVPRSFAQTTEITYQGSLKDNGAAANGSYDIEFRLFSALTGGSQVTGEILRNGVQVTDGVFSVQLDFGATSFLSQDRFLEISVRRTGVGSLVPMSPRQKVSSTPYAIRSLQAVSATTALVATDAVSLGGVSSTQYVITADPRLSDSRNPLPGSANYIQNTSSLQSASNFNVSGTGGASIFDATTRYNFGGNHLMSALGMDNIFAGASAGLLNLGNNNAFFGARAGQENKQGQENSFFGSYAGQNNITGNNNSFFGYFAGNGTTSGNENSFFGNRAGQVNTSGAYNSFFGTFSGLFNTTGSDNSFFGNETGYNSNGNRNSFFGSKAGRENSTGADNAFLGSFAGRANTTGSNNSFVGSNAGQANATGAFNSFIGAGAGFTNSASNNTFVGADAGRFNTVGANNTFLGKGAGQDNTSGELNVFIGTNAANSNTVGRLNTVIGAEADLVGTNLQYATAIGAEATVNTSNTVVLGRAVDTVRIPGNINVLGTLSAANLNVQATNITGVVGVQNGGTGLQSAGTAGRFLRSNGTVWASEPLTVSDILAGSPNYVQNGTTVQGSTNFNISGNGTAGGTFSGNAVNSGTQYSIGGNRVLTATGANLFAGFNAGAAHTTGGANSFFGSSSGAANTSGTNNAFFGSNSGQNASTGSNNTFAGNSSGSGTTLGGNNAFFGINAGQMNTIGNNNTVLGANANVGSNNLSYATAIGADAVVNTSNSVVVGRSVDAVRVPGNLQVDGTLFANSFPVDASNLTGVVAVNRGGTGMAATGSSGNYLRSNGSIWVSSAIAAADIPAGSTNYVQNGLAEQSGVNFNVGGNGTVGGLFSANTVNSSTQYNLAGARVLSNAGSSNIFVGVGAGTTTTGSGNSFFGFGAGAANTTGFSNTIVGSGANLGAGNLSFATAIGAGATVSNNDSVVLGRAADTVRIPGNLSLAGTFTASIPGASITGLVEVDNGGTGLSSSGLAGNVLRSNGTAWTSSPLQASDIPALAGYIQNNTGSPQAGAGFNIGGNGTVGGSLSVLGTFTANLTSANLTGSLGVANGGTGLTAAGTAGHFLKSTGGGFTTAALTTADMPGLSTGFVQNSPGSPQTGGFNLTGSGILGGNMNVSGNVAVGGSLTGSYLVPIGNGGTGLTSPGTNGHFLKSTGSSFTTAALTPADIPGLSTGFIQNAPGSPQTGSFNLTGSGTVGTTMNVGTNLVVGQNATVSGTMTVTGGLTVNGGLSGSYTVPAGNISGPIPIAAGGTGVTGSGAAGNFLRSNGSVWQSSGIQAADLPDLSGSFLQANPSSAQTGVSFNVGGSGTVGTTLTANTVNSLSQYNINGNRAFSTTGTSNVFAGESTGTAGTANAFFGANAGDANTSGSGNTIIGANADVGSAGLSNSTAIGQNATVTQSNSVVLGAVGGVNGGSDVKVGIGTTAPKEKLEVKGNVFISEPGQGVILRPTAGTTCTLLKADGSGGLTVSSIPCP